MKALIVDDERLARHELRLLLDAHREVETVGEADGVEAAVAAIRRLEPDVVFLDVEMRGETGFELLSRLSEGPKIVFVTGFDEYAIRALEVRAFDYLLKPVNPDRLALVLRRLQ